MNDEEDLLHDVVRGRLAHAEPAHAAPDEIDVPFVELVEVRRHALQPLDGLDRRDGLGRFGRLDRFDRYGGLHRRERFDRLVRVDGGNRRERQTAEAQHVVMSRAPL